MHVEKTLVASIDKVYCLTIVPRLSMNGLPAFAAGSESSGPLMFFEPPDYHGRILADVPGGFMSLGTFEQDSQQYLVASTDFKPGFNAADCALVVYPLQAGAAGLVVAKLPYTHRVAVVEMNGRNYCLASTLCSGKAFKDDWTQPGGIHLAEIPDNPLASWNFREIVTGLNKNHGMDFARLNGDRNGGFLLSCQEGLFYLPLAEQPGGKWETEKIAEGEHSDAFILEHGGTDSTEVFTISPFHGNLLSRYCRCEEGWKRTVIDDSLHMGHVLWAGVFLAEPSLLVGERGGKKQLRWFRKGPGTVQWQPRETIDSDIGPTQIAVCNQGPNSEILIVAGHAQNQVIIYEITC